VRAVTRLVSCCLGAAFFVVAPGCSSATPSAEPAGATFTMIYPLFFPVTTKGQCNFCHGLAVERHQQRQAVDGDGQGDRVRRARRQDLPRAASAGAKRSSSPASPKRASFFRNSTLHLVVGTCRSAAVRCRLISSRWSAAGSPPARRTTELRTASFTLLLGAAVILALSCKSAGTAPSIDESCVQPETGLPTDVFCTGLYASRDATQVSSTSCRTRLA